MENVTLLRLPGTDLIFIKLIFIPNQENFLAMILLLEDSLKFRSQLPRKPKQK